MCIVLLEDEDLRLVSILGDSISTYEGYNPTGYAVFYDKERQRRNGLTNVFDTWWAKVNQTLHAYLCVNNSFSGSRVTGEGFPAAISPERVNNLRTNKYEPDIILVYIGFNDFGNGIKTTQKSLFKRFHPLFFEDAYNKMLADIKGIYPTAKVVCGTLLRTRIAGDEYWIFPELYNGTYFEDFNAVIRKVSKKNHCYLADLSSLGIRYETLDGTHPTKAGHQEIANAWLHFLLQMDFINPTIEASIKMYQANKDNDMAVNMVFDSLANERVLIPVDTTGNVTALYYDDQAVIALFTSPRQIPPGKDFSTKIIFIEEQLGYLAASKMNIMVNPFSEEEDRFIIPYPAIKSMLIPVIQRNRK